MTPREAAAVEVALREEWKALRDDARYYDCAAACVRFARCLGLIADAQADTWLAAFRTCPGHDDDGGRSWCAYCGDMPAPPASEATTDAYCCSAVAPTLDALCTRTIGHDGEHVAHHETAEVCRWACEPWCAQPKSNHGPTTCTREAIDVVSPAAPPPGGSRG